MASVSLFGNAILSLLSSEDVFERCLKEEEIRERVEMSMLLFDEEVSKRALPPAGQCP